MKYVMIEYRGVKCPIIFPEIIPHDYFKNMHPVSAGTVELYGAQEPPANTCCCENGIDVSVKDKSVSLELESNPEDAAIISTEVLRHYH